MFYHGASASVSIRKKEQFYVMLRTWQLLSRHCNPRFDEFLISSLCYPHRRKAGRVKYAFRENLVATKVVAEIIREIKFMNSFRREHVVDREEEQLDDSQNVCHCYDLP